MIGHDGELRGGMVMSFMTFPDHGIVVAVTSNTSFAETPSLAVAAAQVFAERRRRLARPAVHEFTTPLY
jgi:hypothetical protein